MNQVNVNELKIIIIRIANETWINVNVEVDIEKKHYCFLSNFRYYLLLYLVLWAELGIGILIIIGCKGCYHFAYLYVI